MKKLLEACGGPDPMGMGAPDMAPEMDKKQTGSTDFKVFWPWQQKSTK